MTNSYIPPFYQAEGKDGLHGPHAHHADHHDGEEGDEAARHPHHQQVQRQLLPRAQGQRPAKLEPGGGRVWSVDRANTRSLLNRVVFSMG